MKCTFIYEVLHSNKRDEDFYVVRLAIKDGDEIVRKSKALIWLTKEQYENLTSSK